MKAILIIGDFGMMKNLFLFWKRKSENRVANGATKPQVRTNETLSAQTQKPDAFKQHAQIKRYPEYITHASTDAKSKQEESEGKQTLHRSA